MHPNQLTSSNSEGTPQPAALSALVSYKDTGEFVTAVKHIPSQTVTQTVCPQSDAGYKGEEVYTMSLVGAPRTQYSVEVTAIDAVLPVSFQQYDPTIVFNFPEKYRFSCLNNTNAPESAHHTLPCESVDGTSVRTFFFDVESSQKSLFVSVHALKDVSHRAIINPSGKTEQEKRERVYLYGNKPFTTDQIAVDTNKRDAPLPFVTGVLYVTSRPCPELANVFQDSDEFSERLTFSSKGRVNLHRASHPVLQKRRYYVAVTVFTEDDSDMKYFNVSVGYDNSDATNAGPPVVLFLFLTLLVPVIVISALHMLDDVLPPHTLTLRPPNKAAAVLADIAEFQQRQFYEPFPLNKDKLAAVAAAPTRTERAGTTRKQRQSTVTVFSSVQAENPDPTASRELKEKLDSFAAAQHPETLMRNPAVAPLQPPPAPPVSAVSAVSAAVSAAVNVADGAAGVTSSVVPTAVAQQQQQTSTHSQREGSVRGNGSFRFGKIEDAFAAAATRVLQKHGPLTEDVTETDYQLLRKSLRKVVSSWFVGPKDFSYLAAVVIFIFGVSGFQVVIADWKRMIATGNRDICFYNEECYMPTELLDMPINNIVSNFGYVIPGLLLLIHLLLWEARKSQGKTEIHVPRRRFSLSYALVWTFTAQGVFSSFYHICPSRLIFQFDTAFMYVLTSLTVIALFQPVNGRQIHAPGYFLFFVVPMFIFNYFGSVQDSYEDNLRPATQGVYWTAFAIWEISVLYYIFEQGKHMKKGLLKPQRFAELHKKEELQKNQTWQQQQYEKWLQSYMYKSVWEKIKKKFRPGTPVRGQFVVASTFIVIVSVTVGATHSLDIAQMFLIVLVFIGMVLGALKFQRFLNHKLKHLPPRIARIQYFTSMFLGVATSFCWILGLYFFNQATTEKNQPPQVSRAFNAKCIDFFGYHYFDAHDIWHLLSGYALFFQCLFVFQINPPIRAEKVVGDHTEILEEDRDPEAESHRPADTTHTASVELQETSQHLDAV
eukprot:TRINITY_DN683_c0_g2_i1.p1 TRINITY_DN683_c0_g2~~TRINITY_DN683_c0_g2_i1.p1  ORF type:complete len:1150 (+),score=303.38 TRINITY_DN683_c0_g2_i1:466-3450(+)